MLSEKDLLIVRNHTQGYVWHWVYQEHGRPIMIVARYESSCNKTYRQFSFIDGKWVEGVPTTSYPLFGLESLANDSPFNAVLLCEGEKCASLLHQLRWNGLATALDATSSSNTDFSPLRHYQQFIILRDNDKAGTAYARDVATAIRKNNPSATVLVCNLTPDIKGGDLIDWIKSKPLYGHSWNGYDALQEDHIRRITEGLQVAIEQHAINIEDCSEVRYSSASVFFENDPKPIHNKLRPVPPYPSHLLPAHIAEYLSLCAKQMCIPVDFPATAFLSLVGGIIGRSIKLEMRPGHGWEEAANVWATLVGSPSSKKSPTMRRIGRSINTLENKARNEYAESYKGYKAREKKATQEKTEFNEPEPIFRRYITDDCTTPKLRELLIQNQRGMILRSDELKGQLEKFDRAGNEGDRSFIMQCWAGTDRYNEDRIIRGSCLEIPLSLTWIGCIQPTCLVHYLRQAMQGGKFADGLMQRFQMLTYPDFEKEFRICNEPMPQSLEKEISIFFENIDSQLQISERRLKFSSKAQARFDSWHTALELDCRSGSHPPHWESHLGKQPKLLASICIILHVLEEHFQNVPSEEISESTLATAEELIAYHLAHALRCYESIENLEFSDARKIIDFVRQKKIPSRFKAADIYHNGIGGIKESSRVANALALLQDFDCVAREKIYGATGKASDFWIIHPKLLEGE